MKWVPNDLYAKYGRGNKSAETKSWAMVTGATDGIGLALAKVLASEHGFNILMVSRSPEKLEAKKAEILKYCNDQVEVVCITQDLSQISKYEEYEKKFTPIAKKYDIAILINNAGLGTLGPLNCLSDSDVNDLVAVNMIHPTLLTKVMLPFLEARTSKSCVINVASVLESAPFAGF